MNYFKESDFDCQETGENQMTQEFYDKIDALREQCGFAFIITSGYRSTNHSLEKKKADKYLAQYEGLTALAFTDCSFMLTCAKVRQCVGRTDRYF